MPHRNAWRGLGRVHGSRSLFLVGLVTSLVAGCAGESWWPQSPLDRQIAAAAADEGFPSAAEVGLAADEGE